MAETVANLTKEWSAYVAYYSFLTSLIRRDDYSTDGRAEAV
jgi:hypothetical protein